jgi:hypothetical protein
MQMKKWIFLLLAMVLVINLVSFGIGCKSKAPEKPAVKEEAKPAEAPAPAAPAATPAPAAPAATKK